MDIGSGGLPGIYKKDRERRAVANAPGVARRNREEIASLEERVTALEKEVQALKGQNE